MNPNDPATAATIPVPPTPTPTPADPNAFVNYLQEQFPLLIQIIAAIAVLVIAYWGLQYMLSNIPGIKLESKGWMKGALWGLILALGAFLILKTINPQILQSLPNFLEIMK